MTPKPAILSLIRSGFFKGVGFSLGMMTTGLFAAAAAMKVFLAGEVISSAELNRNFAISAPEGAIMAFNLAECPEGWAAADGDNGTPDLRGRFIRGMDNMGVGAANVDPQSELRTLGHEQLDAFQGHAHIFRKLHWGENVYPGLQFNWGDGFHEDPTDTIVSDGINGDPRTSSETRPRNVALIYCMRKN